MKIYYYGCKSRPGHYYWEPRSATSIYTREENLTPWGFKVDGKLQPMRGTKDRRWYCKQGEAALHYKDGWTALAWWDYTVDYRPGSCSAFCIEGNYTFEHALFLAKENFPEVFDRYDFEIKLVLTVNG